MTLKVPVNISLTAVANLLAVIGVTGSLVFVGLELRQNQVIAIAGQQQARTVARLEQLLSTYEFNFEEIGVEDIPWEDQTDIQRYIREQRQVYYWTVNENNFYQYQIGLLSEELWEKRLDIPQCNGMYVTSVMFSKARTWLSLMRLTLEAFLIIAKILLKKIQQWFLGFNKVSLSYQKSIRIKKRLVDALQSHDMKQASLQP